LGPDGPDPDGLIPRNGIVAFFERYASRSLRAAVGSMNIPSPAVRRAILPRMHARHEEPDVAQG